tara:strand:+ start:422 stop:2155 length:1734 start_codon:yes stop_codon:yes gene_type:complete
MPELKNTFTAGKMNKDLDERIIPSTEYREALNIGVATSENSDVGAAQNILGNVRLTCAIQGPNQKYLESSRHITSTADPLTDQIYRFINTSGDLPTSDPSNVWMDRIIEFDTTAPLAEPCSSFEEGILVANKEKAVLIDIWKVKSTVISSSEECDGGNTTLVVGPENVFQIRHGMLVHGAGINESDEVYVVSTEIVSINQIKLNLNKALNSSISGVITLEADRVLNFSPDRHITGVNVLDGMIFWTDNYSEPKKINIERSKAGSVVTRGSADLNYSFQDFDQHTRLIVNEINPTICTKESPNPCDDGPDSSKLGCTDQLAFNYDGNATMDDGSCCYVSGCMDPLYVQFDPSACVSNPADCIDLIVDPSTSPCDNLPLEGIYSGNVNVHQYPGDYVSKTQTNHSPLTHDPAIWNLDLRSAKFQFLGGSTTSGFRHDVRYIAVGKTNTYGGRMCRYMPNASATHHPSDNTYLYPPEYSDTAVLPTSKSGNHFTGGLSHPSGFEESVTFFCYQDLLTWYLSLPSHPSFIPDNSYLASPPYQSWHDSQIALSTPPGIFDLNAIIASIQSDMLMVYTDSELC